MGKLDLSPKLDALIAARFWVLANSIGLIFFWVVAMRTWDINHALPGLFTEFFILNVELLLFAMVNAIWFLVILITAFRAKRWYPLIIWMLVMSAWIGAIKYHDHRCALEMEAATKLLSP